MLLTSKPSINKDCLDASPRRLATALVKILDIHIF